MFSVFSELDACADHVTPDRFAHQKLTRSRQVADSLGYGDRQARDVIAANLDLAGVDPRPQVEPDGLGPGQDFGGTAQCPPGGIEAGQKAIARRFDLIAPG